MAVAMKAAGLGRDTCRSRRGVEGESLGNPLHVRETKRTGATTRSAAARIAAHHGLEHWFV